jgi:hypothetical protein
VRVGKYFFSINRESWLGKGLTLHPLQLILVLNLELVSCFIRPPIKLNHHVRAFQKLGRDRSIILNKFFAAGTFFHYTVTIRDLIRGCIYEMNRLKLFDNLVYE